MLHRLSWPNRLVGLCDLFGRSRSWLSTVFYDVVHHLVLLFRGMVEWNARRLTMARLQTFSRAILAAGGGDCYWGYIDGTLRKVCRPGQEQQVYYSGYKKCHCFKYQSIVTSDGLISSLIGPFEGPKGDWPVFIESGLEEKLRTVSFFLFQCLLLTT